VNDFVGMSREEHIKQAEMLLREVSIDTGIAQTTDELIRSLIYAQIAQVHALLAGSKVLG
jgi:hypothetical protein